MAKKEGTETPLMKQYYATKAKYPDAILLYRMGDFYETFGEDAITTSRILGITLTKRSSGSPGTVELAGFPYHAIDTYLPKLVRAGQRVAICEQLEDPKKTKFLVKRGVIELVTPGCSYSEYSADTKSNVFLASVYFTKAEAGLALLDLSTGEFLTTEGTTATIDKLLNSFQPKEVIYLNCGISAAGAALYYLEMTKHDMISHITTISRIDESHCVLLDKFTLRNLELLHPAYEGGSSLVDVIDRTVTPMGGRTLRRWISMPLKDTVEINRRLDVVEHFVACEEERLRVEELLESIGDLERLASKIGVGRLTPREMNQLKVALSCIAPLKELCAGAASSVLMRVFICSSCCFRISAGSPFRASNRARYFSGSEE